MYEEPFHVLGSLGKKNKEWLWEDGNKEKKEETEEISMLNLWDQIFDDGAEQGIGPQKHENRKRIVTWREIED